MATINLRDFYPWYTHDEFAEVPDVIAGELFADRRYTKTHERLIRRFKVHSLDAEAENEAATIAYSSDSPEVIVEMMERHCNLCRALNALPEVQGRRVEARYIQGKSQREIAEAEGVSEEAVSKAIEKGLEAMKKYLNNFASGG